MTDGRAERRAYTLDTHGLSAEDNVRRGIADKEDNGSNPIVYSSTKIGI